MNRRWHIEHCIAGRWHVCGLEVKPSRWNDDVNAAAYRHLRRRRGHGEPVRGRLAGTHHAGGGLGPPWKKLPEEEHDYSVWEGWEEEHT